MTLNKMRRSFSKETLLHFAVCSRTGRSLGM